MSWTMYASAGVGLETLVAHELADIARGGDLRCRAWAQVATAVRCRHHFPCRVERALFACSQFEVLDLPNQGRNLRPLRRRLRTTSIGGYSSAKCVCELLSRERPILRWARWRRRSTSHAWVSAARACCQSARALGGSDGAAFRLGPDRVTARSVLWLGHNSDRSCAHRNRHPAFLFSKAVWLLGLDGV